MSAVPTGNLGVALATIALLLIIVIFVLYLAAANMINTYGLPERLINLNPTTDPTITITPTGNVTYIINPTFTQTITINQDTTGKVNLTGLQFFIDNTANPSDVTLLPGPGVTLPSNRVIPANSSAEFYWANNNGTLRRYNFPVQQ